MKSFFSALIGAFLIASLATPVGAQSLESMRIAQELGDVIGSEDACGLEYDQVAIEQFIDDRVRDDDMGFTSSLNLFTEGARYQFMEMSESSRTAHCRQIRRVARSFGFIQE